ncbi:ABC transporter substrate-binding protein [Bifidobacterium cuniculi]|uniref:Dipeptide ABC transporter periplasmic component n=1 Tax=Bifidobacterium cuniculi TaxID=1688 RepID=A0A087AL23_9BIFI|nr:ABC transporter substrate-binding protein [Bifidobacterium cuniculi]KFI59473.1 dipeptide ABC transporter periplasmic component [Bifidobacterium cuniculi]
MTQPNGVHGNAGATEHDNASFTTDASLASKAKQPSGGPRRARWAPVAFLAVICLILVCIWHPWSRGDDAATTAGEPADTVSIGLKLAPTNLDIRNTAGSALDQVLIGNVYQGLVARNSENEVVPALAKSWEESKDGLTYTFHLNQGVTFSNGDPLTAEDVVWSIQELEDKQYHDSDALKNFKSISAPNDDTVVITLSKPYSNLLWALTGRAGLVFDKDAKYVAKTQAVGSGPYEVESFTPNSSLVLKANPDYWGTKPKTGTIVIKYFADDNAAVNALKSGDVQVLAPISATLAEPFASDTDHYVVAAGDGTDKYVLGMNNADGKATADRRVRQAIRYAINHDELIASRGGADRALGGPIPSLDPGYEDLTALYPYNPDKARELLKEAGYDEDHPLKLTLTYANTYGSEIGDQLRSQLAKVGIDLKVNVVEFSTWLQDVYTDKDYDLSLVDHNESHDFTQWSNPDYYYNYDNEEVQRLTAQAQAATSDEERDTLLAKAARIVSQDAAADWLFNYRVTTATAKGVEGFPLNMNQTVMPLAELTYTSVSGK